MRNEAIKHEDYKEQFVIERNPDMVSFKKLDGISQKAWASLMEDLLNTAYEFRVDEK